jgi:Arc/MetJ-type ribon-helix-helix transcriptional regulator
MVSITIEFDAERLRDIEEMVRRDGFISVSDYLKVVIEAKWLASKVGAQVLDEDGVDIRENLEESFYQALTGQIVPLESLWDDEETPQQGDEHKNQ